MKQSSSSKGKLAPSGPVADPGHINRGPSGMNCAPKGKLAAPYSSPMHRSATKPANVDPQAKGVYPAGMKGKNSTMDKSGKKTALPSTNRSNAGKGGKSSPGGTYSGPKGMKGSPEQGELVKGTASTMKASAPTRYAAPKGTAKAGTGVKP